jgi:hypothetical protein
MANKSKTIQSVTPLRVIGAVFAVLSALLAVSAAIVNSAFRVGDIFVDHEIKILGFTEILFYAMVANSVYAIGVAAGTILKRKIPVAVIILSVFSTVLSLLFWLFNYVAADIAKVETAYILIAGSVPFLAALFGVPFLLLCFPNLKISDKSRNIIAAVLATLFVVTIGGTAIIKAPPISFEFDSMPVVFDIGGDQYSVVFATNAESQGYVTYTTVGGDTKTVYSNSAGVKTVGRIHAVKIPRDDLDGATYTAYATRVLNRLSYGGKLGKTISAGKDYTLKDTTDKNDPKIISASDWHNELGTLEGSSAYFKAEADLVIFNGDFADFYVNEQQVIKYFLGGAHILTGGEIPGIFVRGNHEVRGNFAVEDALLKIGLSTHYYQTYRGNNVFTILDTAEAEGHDTWEHEGFYDMIPYFNAQLDWFESLPNVTDLNQDGKDDANILFLHDSGFTGTHDDAHIAVKERFAAKASQMNVLFSASGDSHAYRHYQPDDLFKYDRIEDGGNGGGSGGMSAYDLEFLKASEQSPIVQTILRLIPIKKGDNHHTITLISITETQVIVKGIDDKGEEKPTFIINRK